MKQTVVVQVGYLVKLGSDTEPSFSPVTLYEKNTTETLRQGEKMSFGLPFSLSREIEIVNGGHLNVRTAYVQVTLQGQGPYRNYIADNSILLHNIRETAKILEQFGFKIRE